MPAHQQLGHLGQAAHGPAIQDDTGDQSADRKVARGDQEHPGNHDADRGKLLDHGGKIQRHQRQVFGFCS